MAGWSLKLTSSIAVLTITAIVAIQVTTSSLHTTSGARSQDSRSAEPLSAPEDMVSVGDDLWVANSSGNSLAEIDMHTGAILRVVSAKHGDLLDPWQLTFGGGSIWVADWAPPGRVAVTEINATTGSLVRTLPSLSHGVDEPFGIAFGGGHLWLTSGGNESHNSSVVEVNPKSGKILRFLRKDVYDATSVTLVGNDVWITNQLDNSLVEFDARSGALVRWIHSIEYHLDEPYALAATASGQVWISNGQGQYPLTEIDATNGRLLRVIRKSKQWSRDPYDSSWPTGPWSLSIYANTVWVANTWNLVELNAKTGHVIRIVSKRADHLIWTQYVLADAADVWASDSQAQPGAITEINRSTGALVRVIR